MGLSIDGSEMWIDCLGNISHEFLEDVEVSVGFRGRSRVPTSSYCCRFEEKEEKKIEGTWMTMMTVD